MKEEVKGTKYTCDKCDETFLATTHNLAYEWLHLNYKHFKESQSVESENVDLCPKCKEIFFKAMNK